MGRKQKSLSLNVFLNEVLVGHLTRGLTGETSFRYAPDWLESSQAIPISNSIPLRESPHRGDQVLAFFDNLLPDNDRIRQRVAEKTGSDGKNALDLLGAIGRDCVGALQFIPDGLPMDFTTTMRARVLSRRQIATLLRNLASTPLGIDPSREFRISIAGAQEKTALLKWKGKWRQPLGTTPTSHILKPALASARSWIF